MSFCYPNNRCSLLNPLCRQAPAVRHNICIRAQVQLYSLAVCPQLQPARPTLQGWLHSGRTLALLTSTYTFIDLNLKIRVWNNISSNYELKIWGFKAGFVSIKVSDGRVMKRDQSAPGQLADRLLVDMVLGDSHW